MSQPTNVLVSQSWANSIDSTRNSIRSIFVLRETDDELL